MNNRAGVGKRERLARALHRTGALRLVMKARSHLPDPLSVLTYHSIAARAEPGFDEAVVDATPDQFHEQLAFVAKYFSVVTIDDVIDAMAGTGKLPPNPLLITFDDGYRSCIDTALPILAAHGLRATFFVATHYVENRRIYWWDRINYLINNSPRPDAHVDYPRRIELDMSSRASTIAELLRTVKEVRDLDLPRYLAALTEATEVPFSDDLERELAEKTIMTWDQVRALRDAGMDVQSHTQNHRVLQTLDDATLRDELTRSRRDLERALGDPIRAIAYPVGGDISHLPRVRAALDESGYSIGFTNATGINYPWQLRDRWNLRRLAVNRDASLAMFASSLALPPLAYVTR